MEYQPESSEKSQALNNTWTSNPGSYQQSTYATKGAGGCLDTGAVAPPPNYGNGNTTLVVPNSGPSSAESSMEVASVPHHQCWETTDEMRARILMSNSSNEIMQMLRRKEIVIVNKGKLIQLQSSAHEKLRKIYRELDENLEAIKSNLKRTETSLKNAQAEINGLKRDYNNHTNVINNLAGENQKLTAERDQLSKVATTNSREITDLKAKLKQMEDKFNDAEARNARLVEKDNDNKVALGKLKAEKENIELSLKVADEENQILKSSYDKLANKYLKLKSLAEEALPGYDTFTQKAGKLFGNLSPNPELNKDSSQYGSNDSELISITPPIENTNPGEQKTKNKRSFDSDDEVGDLVIDESPLKRK